MSTTQEIAHNLRAHATYSPSGASAWMKCGQAIDAKKWGKGATYFTQEGTAAHEVCELCLARECDADEFMDMYIDLTKLGDERLADEGDPDEFNVWKIDGEMVDSVQTYLDVIRAILIENPGAELEVEQRIDLRHLGADIWGTGDAVIYHPATQKVWVVDFKYGRGYAVAARQNPQLLVYAVGASHRLHNRGVQDIELVIVQPRADHPEGRVRRYVTDWTELVLFTEEIMAGVAITGGEPVGGDHCAFCPIMSTCDAYLGFATDRIGLDLSKLREEVIELPPIASLTDEEKVKVWINADVLSKWVKAVHAAMLAEAHAGRIPAGLKMVEGRSYRKWMDEAQARSKLLNAGVDPSDIMKTKFVSPNAVEKAIGKKRAATLVGSLVYKAPGKMTLVPVEDPRDDVRPAAQYSDVSEESET